MSERDGGDGTTVSAEYPESAIRTTGTDHVTLVGSNEDVESVDHANGDGT